jgi:hypothetical protein
MVTQKKIQSIGKKFSCHKLSAARVKVHEIVFLAKKETVETLNAELQAQLYTTTYFIILSCLSNCRTELSHDRLNQHLLTFKKQIGWRWDAFYSLIMRVQAFVILLLVKCKGILLSI